MIYKAKVDIAYIGKSVNYKTLMMIDNVPRILYSDQTFMKESEIGEYFNKLGILDNKEIFEQIEL